MSTVLQMLAVNARLAEYESFEREVAAGKYRGSWSAKQPEKLAKAIFAQLSHVKAVEIVAREWDVLPAQVRLELGNLCNTGNASGNVRKNVQVLDQKLGGRVLREAKHTEYVNVRREGADGVRYEKKAVNPAVQGAHRKYQKV